MQLAGHTLDSPFIFAPLAGITSMPIRLLARRSGAALVFTEMIPATRFTLNNTQNIRPSQILPEEHPLAIQLFGADPKQMRYAAKKVRELGADILNINLGCPAQKIRRQEAGSALLENPILAAAVVAGAAEGWKGPVTVKLRLGYNHDNLTEIIPGLIAAGAAAIFLHARTTKQGFRGKANWQAITSLKSWCPVPVIGNGDIFNANNAVAMLKETKCDGVMIGRGALSNPWIFTQANDLLAKRNPQSINLTQRHQTIVKYTKLALKENEAFAIHISRLLLIWLCKGLPKASNIRRAACYTYHWKEIIKLSKQYFLHLKIR